MKQMHISMSTGFGCALLPVFGGTTGGVRLEQVVRPWVGDVISNVPSRQRDRGYDAVASTTAPGLPSSAPPITT